MKTSKDICLREQIQKQKVVTKGPFKSQCTFTFTFNTQNKNEKKEGLPHTTFDTGLDEAYKQEQRPTKQRTSKRKFY